MTKKLGFRPYPAENATIILDEEMGKKEPWEGGQGDDSFHAWQLDNGTWMAFCNYSYKCKDPPPPSPRPVYLRARSRRPSRCP